MELLIIKTGDRYLRLKEERWIAVGLGQSQCVSHGKNGPSAGPSS